MVWIYNDHKKQTLRQGVLYKIQRFIALWQSINLIEIKYVIRLRHLITALQYIEQKLIALKEEIKKNYNLELDTLT